MRFGVIGSNFIAREFVRAGQATDGFSFACMYSRSLERARSFAEPFGCTRATDDLDALASDDEIDAVYIASPNCCHYDQARRMLSSGKHVLLEKPACPTQAAFHSLRGTARDNGLLLLEGMRMAYVPGFAALEAALGSIGTIRRASFSYCQYSSRYDKYKRGIVENAFDPSLCNGALMDIGVYCVFALVRLFGVPSSIQASAQQLDNGLDAQGSATLRYDGMLADVGYSKIASGRRESEIQGEDGTLLIDRIEYPKRIVRVGRDGTIQTLFTDADTDAFGLGHEIRTFTRMAQDPAQAETMNDATESTLGVMDKMRRLTGVDFVRRDA